MDVVARSSFLPSSFPPSLSDLKKRRERKRSAGADLFPPLLSLTAEREEGRKVDPPPLFPSLSSIVKKEEGRED